MRNGTRRASAALMLTMVAACEPIALGLFAGSAPSIGVRGGAVTVTGPEGYCVDTGGSQPASGFALMGSCAVLDGGEGTAIPAILTAQVGDADSAIVDGSESALAAYLRTSPGRSLLSHRNEAIDISVAQSRAADNRVTVVFDDRGPRAVPGTRGREWRAFFDLEGRLVTVSVRSLTDASLNVDAGLALLDRTVRAIKAANPSET